MEQTSQRDGNGWRSHSSLLCTSSPEMHLQRLKAEIRELPAQTAPGGADQNVVGALRLRGALNREALQGALQSVMARHDSLRTRFAIAADGSLLQVGLSAPSPSSVALSGPH